MNCWRAATKSNSSLTSTIPESCRFKAISRTINHLEQLTSKSAAISGIVVEWNDDFLPYI